MRAALYARYSTDRQRETSIGDQLRAAHDRAAREGWPIVATHADEGISGSTPVALRPGGKALLADALAGRFDVLILEGLDRLSRELGEAETRRLEHRGIRIVGTADGYDSQAHGPKVMRIAPPPDLSGLLADVTSRYRRLLLQLEDVLRDEDRERTRAILADLLGQVTVVHEGREVFAELEDPAQRLLLAAAGGSAESLGGVAGARNSSRRLRRVRLA